MTPADAAKRAREIFNLLSDPKDYKLGADLMDADQDAIELAIQQALIDAHNGAIEAAAKVCESAPDRLMDTTFTGATFAIRTLTIKDAGK